MTRRCHERRSSAEDSEEALSVDSVVNVASVVIVVTLGLGGTVVIVVYGEVTTVGGGSSVKVDERVMVVD